MTTLAARITALRERLTNVDQSSAKVAEAGALEDLRFELSGRIDRLAPSLATQALLAKAGIDAPSPPSLADVRSRSAELLRRFRTEPTAATLKRGQNWQHLLKQSDRATTDLGASVLDSWRAFRARVFAGETPAAIRGRLARTKPNNEAFEVYRGLHQRLQAAFQELPQNLASIDQVRRLGEQFEDTAAKFDFDVPTEVKAFLEAVQSVNGAPLTLLTPAVQVWLKDNHSLDNYRIRSADR